MASIAGASAGTSVAFAESVGRVAAVTGSNKGIGFFIALQLASSGLFSNVILGCRDPTRGEKAVSDIQKEMLRKVDGGAATSNSSPCHISYLPLSLGDKNSHELFQQQLESSFGRLDVLVNNAATAFKGSDPTPFHEQTKPTLDINYRATMDLTMRLLPLMRTKGTDARIVNVASMAGHLGQISSSALRQELTSPTLTLARLNELVEIFEAAVQKRDGSHRTEEGWGNSNYGTSKLALIAATKVLSREETAIKVNCCCPGYCDTDMTSHKGTRSPDEGAKNAVLPATMSNCPTGQFFQNFQVSEW